MTIRSIFGISLLTKMRKRRIMDLTLNKALLSGVAAVQGQMKRIGVDLGHVASCFLTRWLGSHPICQWDYPKSPGRLVRGQEVLLSEWRAAMFYIMTQQGHKVIELSDQRPTQEQLEKLAQECHVDLYVIEGEHSGITYTRPKPISPCHDLALV